MRRLPKHARPHPVTAVVGLMLIVASFTLAIVGAAPDVRFLLSVSAFALAWGDYLGQREVYKQEAR